ncbi:hypothetical protein HPB52_015437 [Rhipicephalus sanguineus]|uniref:CCHC-type domain-containing protein n=1 Tax=Rhipicephalus sanguineus TaxID=34632 RepID=A0A9D4PD31_RHISA|nr:hypothetical protein HPB52_015437 [Rhipicephalus sanguineus]
MTGLNGVVDALNVKLVLLTGFTPGCCPRPLGHAPVLVFDLGASPDAVQGASRAVLEPGPRPALFRHPGYVTVLTCCRGRAKVRRKPDCVEFFGPAAAPQDRRPQTNAHQSRSCGYRVGDDLASLCSLALRMRAPVDAHPRQPNPEDKILSVPLPPRVAPLIPGPGQPPPPLQEDRCTTEPPAVPEAPVVLPGEPQDQAGPAPAEPPAYEGAASAAQGFRHNHEKVAAEAVGPPLPCVNVYPLPAYLPDDVLTNALQLYGKQYKLNGVSAVKMEMCKPVPNFPTIQGHRVMCEYRGMHWVCARCGDDGHMAIACTNPYCKRCGVFGHDTEGCMEECKRCSGRHGTRECFRRRSYVAAARGFPPANEPAPAHDQSSGQASSTGSMGTSGLQVLKPRSPLSTARKAPDYWDGDKTKENDAMSAATSDRTSADPSSNSPHVPHPSSDEQEVPTTEGTLDGVALTSPHANDESNAPPSHGSGRASNLDDMPIISSGRYVIPPDHAYVLPVTPTQASRRLRSTGRRARLLPRVRRSPALNDDIVHAHADDR